MAAALEMIRAASIQADVLVAGAEPLTSEAVRRHIHHVLLDCDCSAEHTIVAGGEQAIDPHQEGHGPLPAHRPIILDIFPRHAPSGYFGDITRTVVRGQVSKEVQRLYDTVAAAQQGALDGLRDGADGADVHVGVIDHFADAGYESGERDGRMQGFFHGTGHGVGLEIHEAPSLSRRSCALQSGHAVTVEPGLYYAGVGGVRIEDLVVVDADGYLNLTRFPKALSL
jgi:Xaa-Pro aminopeptidase